LKKRSQKFQGVDTLLPSLDPGCTRIALAYDFQLIDKVPAEEHDARVDIVITEHQVHIAAD
jgi:5-formyltetrahydrofolate cyclo-ligase